MRFIALATVLWCACASNDSQVKRPAGATPDTAVTVVRSRGQVRDCYLIGDTPPTMDWKLDAFKEETKRQGGDTLLNEGFLGPPPKVYVCDPEKVRTLKARDAARAEVRITNRQDVVTPCRFIANVTAASEAQARAQTVDLKGNVFFVVSDTTRTAVEKPSGSNTAYNFEVRRLTGEVYFCPQDHP